MKISKLFSSIWVLSYFVFSLHAQQNVILQSKLNSLNKDTIIFMDVNNDTKPDLLETWWNGKRCRWIDENGNMKKTDRRGDMVGDALQVDMDGDGFYDGQTDMNINWGDNDADGMADLMTVAINTGKNQKEPWGGHSHYMHFVDTDKDGVNHFVDWDKFEFHSWKHTEGCNFSPDYNGNSIFIKTHLSPWSLTDTRFNWENPFAFYDFDDDGCTEMTVRYLNSHKKNDSTYTYNGFAETVQMGFDLDNDSQKGQEFDFDMSLGFTGKGVDYRKKVNKYPSLKAPVWTLPYYRYSNYRKIDELVYMPHAECFDEAMKAQWTKTQFVFDEDGDDHRWERVEFYNEGDPYEPRPAKNGTPTTSVVKNNQADSRGDRGEWDNDFSGKGQLYVGQWDNKIHLYGAETGIWLIDDGKYFGSGSAPRACSPDIAPKVGEVVQYKDTNADGFIDFISYDYDGDKTVDFEVSLLAFNLKKPQLLAPANIKWQGLHEQFKTIAKQSWTDAQLLYRAAWKAGMTDAKLQNLAIASSTWEKYHKGYWLKEILFRTLYAKFNGNNKKQNELKRAYFTGDYKAMCLLISL